MTTGKHVRPQETGSPWMSGYRAHPDAWVRNKMLNAGCHPQARAPWVDWTGTPYAPPDRVGDDPDELEKRLDSGVYIIHPQSGSTEPNPWARPPVAFLAHRGALTHFHPMPMRHDPSYMEAGAFRDLAATVLHVAGIPLREEMEGAALLWAANAQLPDRIERMGSSPQPPRLLVTDDWVFTRHQRVMLVHPGEGEAAHVRWSELTAVTGAELADGSAAGAHGLAGQPRAVLTSYRSSSNDSRPIFDFCAGPHMSLIARSDAEARKWLYDRYSAGIPIVEESLPPYIRESQSHFVKQIIRSQRSRRPVPETRYYLAGPRALAGDPLPESFPCEGVLSWTQSLLERRRFTTPRPEHPDNGSPWRVMWDPLEANLPFRLVTQNGFSLGRRSLTCVMDELHVRPTGLTQDSEGKLIWELSGASV